MTGNTLSAVATQGPVEDRLVVLIFVLKCPVLAKRLAILGTIFRTHHHDGRAFTLNAGKSRKGQLHAFARYLVIKSICEDFLYYSGVTKSFLVFAPQTHRVISMRSVISMRLCA